MPSTDFPFLPDSVVRATGIVYHYTSAVGLMAMLQSGKVWASEAASMNDLAEVRQGWDSLRHILATKPDSAAVDLLRAIAHDPLKSNHEVFVLSATTSEDDANQWRLYADRGKGYALGLDAAVQLATVSNDPVPPGPPPRPRSARIIRMVDGASVTPWLHVLYDDAAIEKVVDDLITMLESEYANLDSLPVEHQEFVMDSIRDGAKQALATIAHLVKSPGFRGENEARVVATFDFGTSHIDYRAGEHGLIGYANLTEAPTGRSDEVLRPTVGLSLDLALPISSVRLGPLLSAEQQDTVRGYVKRHANGRKIEVLRSEVPLR